MTSLDIDFASARARLAASRLYDHEPMLVDTSLLSLHGSNSNENSSSMTLLLHNMVLENLAKPKVAHPSPLAQQSMQIDTSSASTSGSLSPLSLMNDEELAKHLISILGETSMQLSLYRKFVAKLGASGIQNVLHETELAVSPGGSESLPTVKTDKDAAMRPRTASGVFIKKAKAAIKRSEVEEKTREETAKTKAGGIELFAHQQEAIERIMRLNALTPELHHKGRNLVICAPTGSGKTMIFIEVSKRLLCSNPEAKILVLVPTIALLAQQCAAFRAAGFGGDEIENGSGLKTSPEQAAFRKRHRADWFCGDKPLKAESWQHELRLLSVLVIECGSFRNLLQDPQGRVCLSHIDLLVLDECHHAKEEHPYAVVLRYYNRLKKLHPSLSPSSSSRSLDLASSLAAKMSSASPSPTLPPWSVRYQKKQRLENEREEGEGGEGGDIVDKGSLPNHRPPPHPPPHVLGFSATPAGGSSDQIVRSNMASLLSLLSADIHIVNEQDVVDIAPPPSEEAVEVEARDEDIAFINVLEGMLLQTAMALGLQLVGMSSSCSNIDEKQPQDILAETKQAIDGLVLDLRRIILAAPPSQPLKILQAQSVNKWANDLNALATAWHKEGMSIGLSILNMVKSCIEMTVEMGMECGLRLLLRRVLAIATKAAKLSSEADPKDAGDAEDAGDAGDGDAGDAMEVEGVALGQDPPSSGSSPASEENEGKGLGLLISHKALHDRVREELMLESLAVGGQGLGSIGSMAPPPPPSDFNGQALIDLCRTILNQVAPPPPTPSCLTSANLNDMEGIDEVAYLELLASIPSLQLFIPGLLPTLIDGSCPSPSSSSSIHPKIKALYSYLARHKNKPEFHGIIFTRTRQGATMLHEVFSLAMLPWIDSLDLIMGHGSMRNSNGIAGIELGARGMSSKAQMAILERFKSKGRRLLIATSAAEEGIDCPGCEFVVRFSSPASGTQRIQSKGRGRKLGSIFFSIVLKAEGGGGASLMHMDHLLDSKSKVEEEAIKRVLNERAMGS